VKKREERKALKAAQFGPVNLSKNQRLAIARLNNPEDIID
jgi:hypothetical protein